MKILLPLVPACAAFGPLFIVMGIGPEGAGVVSMLGAFMTTVSLLAIFFLVAEHARELQARESLAENDESDSEETSVHRGAPDS